MSLHACQHFDWLFFFLSRRHIFPHIDCSTHFSPAYIQYTVKSHPFSKQDRVQFEDTHQFHNLCLHIQVDIDTHNHQLNPHKWRHSGMDLSHTHQCLSRTCLLQIQVGKHTGSHQSWISQNRLHHSDMVSLDKPAILMIKKIIEIIVHFLLYVPSIKQQNGYIVTTSCNSYFGIFQLFKLPSINIIGFTDFRIMSPWWGKMKFVKLREILVCMGKLETNLAFSTIKHT